MNFSAIFIKRPIATTLIMLGMLIFGIMGYLALPVNNLPNVDYPTISISADLAGASPETMAASVASPIERELSAIAGIDSMSSLSTLGRTRITLQFALDRNIDGAALDVQSALSKVQRRLPEDMTTPPSFQKVNPSEQPILYIALSSRTLPLSTVNDYATTFLSQRISMISGVAQVQVYGTKKYAVRVQLDPKALISRGIGINEISDAIAENNVKLPTGILENGFTSSNIESKGQLYRAEEYRPLIVSWQGGGPVRLEEIGNVVDGFETEKNTAFLVDEPAIMLAVSRQPGSNTVVVVDEIRKLLPLIEKQLPASINMTVMFDRSEGIRESIADVKFTLILTIFLVVMVIYLFLNDFLATVIPSLAVPMSIVVTFAVMLALGYSLNNLSLMALTLAVGFVVDDAIVMLENIVRHMEMGKSALKAALDGSKEIGFTIFSMTISLAAVFIPIVFMEGIIGRLFREFAVVIIVAVLLSGFVSLTMTPMLCNLFLKKNQLSKPTNFITGPFEASFAWMSRWYARTLNIAVTHKRATFFLSIVIFAVTGWMFAAIPKGFLPSEDTGQLSGYTEAAQSSSFAYTLEQQKKLHEILAADPAVDVFMSNVGGGFSGGANTGSFFVKLKPSSERDDSPEEIIARLRETMNRYPGIRVFFVNPPSINVGGRVSKALYQYTLQNPDVEELYKYATLLETAMKTLPQIIDVNSDLQLKTPKVIINIDRDKVAALGVSAEQVEEALQLAFAEREISTIYTDINDYPVIMELSPEYRRDQDALSFIYIKSKNGALVPLSTLAFIENGVGPFSVNHSGQLPAVTISFNLAQGVSLSQAVQAVEALSKDMLPATFAASFQGTAQVFQSSMQGMALLIVVAILIIYIMLGVLYESFIHPITILSGLPSAGFGALAILWLFNMDLDLYGFVGVIMLLGIVKKNAIMMIDFALEAERDQHMQPEEAIVRGCLVRFRPIMMTTLSTFIGVLPIAIGIGAGADARRPLGMAVVGGLVFSQIITLYITPVYYVYLDKLSRNAGKYIKSLFSKEKTDATNAGTKTM